MECLYGQTFKYKSDHWRDMKFWMHKKFSDKFSGSTNIKEPRRAMSLKELQHRSTEFERELHK